MKFKTIMVSALLAGSMQQAWAMDAGDMATLTAALAKLTATCETHFQSIDKRLQESESKLARLEKEIGDVKNQIGGFRGSYGQGDKKDIFSNSTVSRMLYDISQAKK